MNDDALPKKIYDHHFILGACTRCGIALAEPLAHSSKCFVPSDALLAQIESLTREKAVFRIRWEDANALYKELETERDTLRAELDAAKVDADTSGNYVADRETEPRMVTFSNRRIVRVVGDGYLEIEHATK